MAGTDRRERNPPKLTKISSSTWSTNNPCSKFAQEYYVCKEKNETCEEWRKKYKKCIGKGYNSKKYFERIENLDKTQKTAGFTVYTWK
eukprot:gene4597-7979_t